MQQVKGGPFIGVPGDGLLTKQFWLVLRKGSQTGEVLQGLALGMQD